MTKKERDKKFLEDLLKKIIGEYTIKISEEEFGLQLNKDDKIRREYLKQLKKECKDLCDVYQIVIYNWEW